MRLRGTERFKTVFKIYKHEVSKARIEAVWVLGLTPKRCPTVSLGASGIALILSR